LIGRTWPSRPSSPTKTRRRRFAKGSPAISRKATATGRSSDAPTFRNPAGARLTVTTPDGREKPLFRSADRTRSRASRTLGSGRPTIVNAGRPDETSTSTSRTRASIPIVAAE
jgi:hypothetical protein